MSFPPTPDDPGSARETGKSLYSRGSDAFLAGVAVIVPLIVTLYILWIALQFLGEVLWPLVGLLEWIGLVDLLVALGLFTVFVELGIYESGVAAITEFIAFAALMGIILAVGSFGRHRSGERIIQFFDYMIARVPGIGTVYTSFRRVGDMMTDNTWEEFEGVKLVELYENVYVLGFETNRAPAPVCEATEEMLAIFLPFAPNPVTGGFLTYIPEDRVIDLDMSVEDAVRNIITSGIAGDDDADIPENPLAGVGGMSGASARARFVSAERIGVTGTSPADLNMHHSNENT